MGKQKIKSRKGTTRLINRLEKFEWFSQEEWKVLVNQTVPQLMQIQVDQKGKKMTLSASLDNMVALSEYLNNRQEMGTIITFIWRTLKVARECERHGLRIECLLWDPKRIYVDQQNGEIRMVYWPVIGLNQNTKDALNYYKSFISIMKKMDMAAQIQDEYSAYFYQRENFDLHSFYYLMDSIVGYWKRNQTHSLGLDQDDPEPFYRKPPETNVISAYLEKDSEQIMLGEQMTTFGRDKSVCDVELAADVFVSRCHAKIDNEDGRFFLTDLGSVNGTYINDFRLKPGVKKELFDGVKVRFGKTCFVFHVLNSTATTFIHQ